MIPFGLTTIVDLAPRLVLPFSLQAALWLEITGALVLSAMGVVLHVVRRGSRGRGSLRTATGPSGHAGVSPARVIPLRRALGEGAR